MTIDELEGLCNACHVTDPNGDCRGCEYYEEIGKAYHDRTLTSEERYNEAISAADAARELMDVLQVERLEYPEYLTLRDGLDGVQELLEAAHDARQQKNKPLTLEELNSRNKPVWVGGNGEFYALCNHGHIIPPSGRTLSAECVLSTGWMLYDEKPEVQE